MSMIKPIALVGFAFALVAPVAPAADSPQFRGPSRDGIYPGEGLLQSWPEGGPPQLWVATGLGEGFASIVIAEGRIFTTGEAAGEGYLIALSTRGKPQWKQGYGEIHNGGGYPGTRTTPTFEDGFLYLLSSAGTAMAVDAASGEVRWQVDLVEAYSARNIRWGLTESPLVVDDKVIFTPGGGDATLVALDKKTGAKVWATTGVEDTSAYCSPRLLVTGEIRQIVTMTARHLIGIEPANGAVIWKHRYPGKYDIHAVSPVFGKSSIFVSDGYGQGTQMFELAKDGKSVNAGWKHDDLDVHHGGLVLAGGHIYGAADNGTWYALDAASGAVQSSLRRAGKGAIIHADGRLYGYTEGGEVLLVDPEPDAMRIVGKLESRAGEGQHWSHPVVADSVLYVRHGDALTAFDIGEK